MIETMNYILKKLDYLERENRRLASSKVSAVIFTAAVGGCVLYFKNRKITGLKKQIQDLEKKLKKSERTERE